MAFKHATAGELWKSENVSSHDSSPSRRRLLWWCCLVRDRVLALGMRRPYRLHREPFQDPMTLEQDFGLEAVSPVFTDIQRKRIEIAGFVWLCKLSEIMAAVAVFQRRNRFARDWVGDSSVDMSELAELRDLDQDITNWSMAFETHVNAKIHQNGKTDLVVPFVILRVVCKYVLCSPSSSPHDHTGCTAADDLCEAASAPSYFRLICLFPGQ